MEFPIQRVYGCMPYLETARAQPRRDSLQEHVFLGLPGTGYFNGLSRIRMSFLECNSGEGSAAGERVEHDMWMNRGVWFLLPKVPQLPWQLLSLAMPGYATQRG